MVTKKHSWFSLVGAALFGAALTVAMGANNPKTPAFPKYAVYNHGPFLQITDNETNKQYIYLNTPNEPSKLLGYVDLTQTGQAEIKAVKVEKAEK